MYKKKYYRRKAVAKKPSRWQIYKAAGSQLWRDVKWLKSVVNVERKYSDYTFNSTVSTTENFQLINGLSLGDTAITREGQSIKMSSLFVRFYMTMSDLAVVTQVRVIIVMDKQPNASTITSAALLQNNGSIISPLLIDYGSRFKVFFDKIYRLDTNKLNLVTKKFLKLRFHTKFNTGNAGTIADITKNSLYIMMVSDQSTNLPTVEFWARIRFIDN